MGANTVKQLFLEAVEEYAPAERIAFLRRACPDPDIRRQVEILLRAHLRHDPLLDSSNEYPDHRLGSQIGRYQLLEEIGEGGFGVVYRAEQVSCAGSARLPGQESG